MNASSTTDQICRLRWAFRVDRGEVLVHAKIAASAIAQAHRTRFASVRWVFLEQGLTSQDGKLSGLSFEVSPGKGRDHYPAEICNSLYTPLHTALTFRRLARVSVTSFRGLQSLGNCLRQPLELEGPRLLPTFPAKSAGSSVKGQGPTKPAHKSGCGMPPGKGV